MTSRSVVRAIFTPSAGCARASCNRRRVVAPLRGGACAAGGLRRPEIPDARHPDGDQRRRRIRRGDGRVQPVPERVLRRVTDDRPAGSTFRSRGDRQRSRRRGHGDLHLGGDLRILRRSVRAEDDLPLLRGRAGDDRAHCVRRLVPDDGLRLDLLPGLSPGRRGPRRRGNRPAPAAAAARVAGPGLVGTSAAAAAERREQAAWPRLPAVRPPNRPAATPTPDRCAGNARKTTARWPPPWVVEPTAAARSPARPTRLCVRPWCSATRRIPPPVRRRAIRPTASAVASRSHASRCPGRRMDRASRRWSRRRSRRTRPRSSRCSSARCRRSDARRT